MNVRTNITIGFLVSVVFTLATPTVLSHSQPLPHQTPDKIPTVPVKVSPHLSAASVALLKELGVTSDTPTSLQYSTDNLDLSRIKACLKKGADVNAVTLSGHTPLWLAVDAARADIVNLLLDHGAKIDCRDHNNETPLMLAAEKNKLSMVKLLLKRGADVNAHDSDKNTVLMHALRWIQTLDTIDVVKELLEHHAKTDPRDLFRKTVLGEALNNEPKPTKMIELLQKYGAKE